MNKFYSVLKATFFTLFFFTISIYTSKACISTGGILINNEIDNNTGIFTYDIQFVISSQTTAAFADLKVNPGVGTISNCNGGSCDNFAITPGMTVTATLEKNYSAWSRGGYRTYRHLE